MIIKLKNYTGEKNFKVGFSWTTLFFGLFVPLFRGDFLWFLGMIFFSIITLGLSGLIFPFIYNKMYLEKMIKNYAYKTDDKDTIDILRNHKIFIGFDLK